MSESRSLKKVEMPSTPRGVGFALAVTHPFAGNLGGGGYMLIRLADGRTTFIDFREQAPGKASRNMYLDANGKLTHDSIEGWRSSGVPGTVKGFDIAVSKYGKRKWAEDWRRPSNSLRKVFRFPYALAESLKANKHLANSPKIETHLPEGGRVLRNGGRQADAARTRADARTNFEKRRQGILLTPRPRSAWRRTWPRTAA